MALTKTNKLSTVDTVCKALETDILSMHYSPGEKITENELATRYAVSRNTLREACAHLISQGYLTKEANKSLYVKRFTAEDVREVFQFRAMLELEALQRIGHPIDLTHLYALSQEMENTDRNLHWDHYVKLDIAFHEALVRAANSPRLSKLYDAILAEVKLCIFQTRNSVPVPKETSVPHRDILEALEENDLSKTSALLRQHIHHVIHRYSQGMEETQ